MSEGRIRDTVSKKMEQEAKHVLKERKAEMSLEDQWALIESLSNKDLELGDW